MTFTKEIYQEIQKAVNALPESAVERTKGVQTKKGYDTTGYGYQWLVNILNEVVGVDGWTFEYTLANATEGAFSSGQKFYDITVNVNVEILGAKRVCAGGHKSTLYADALKGAITNGLKKTLALFGVGKQAYEGTIDDDNTPLPEETPTRVYTPNQSDKNEPKPITVHTPEEEMKIEIGRLLEDRNPLLATPESKREYLKEITGYDVIDANLKHILAVLTGEESRVISPDEAEKMMNVPEPKSAGGVAMKKALEKK